MLKDAAKRISQIQKDLDQQATEISQRYDGAPAVVIVAGSQKADIPRCVTGFSLGSDQGEGRMRDRLGVLEAAKQIEAFNHLFDDLIRQHEVIMKIKKAIQEIAQKTGTTVDLDFKKK